MFYIKNAAEVSARLNEWLIKTRLDVMEVYRGVAIAVFHYVALNTPQWSGNAASNWNIDVGAPTFRVTTSLKEGAVFMAESAVDSGWKNVSRWQFGVPVASKGDPRAVEMAVARNSGFSLPSLETDVFINNAAEDLDGKKYIRLLEENPGNYLRPENEPGHMVAMCVAEFNAKFPVLTPSIQEGFRKVRLGNHTNNGLL